MICLRGKRILVVEDEPIVAMCLEDMLLEMGCEVVGPAARVAEALPLAASGAIDAAILDINLGGERSYPIADLLSARSVPFAFATGYDRVGYDKPGPAPLIEKPYQPERVAAVLRALLG